MAKRKLRILDTKAVIELEDSIIHFAMAMERKYNQTGKGNSYISMSKRDLLFKLMEEFSELIEAVRHTKPNKNEECVDVALVSMMIKENAWDYSTIRDKNKKN